MPSSAQPQDLQAAAETYRETLRRLKEESQDSLSVFCRGFLRDKFRLPMAPFQLAMCQTVERLAGRTRDVVEVPREHGKTTLRSLAAPLWLALTKRKRHICIVGESLGSAQECLSNIKDELNENVDLRMAYGDLGEHTARLWQADLVILSDGTVIRAIGKGQSIRGVLRRGTRPDLIIVDDPQKLAGVRNHEQREKDWRWVTAEVLPALDKKVGDLLINGTRLHRFCVTAQAARMATELDEAGNKANDWTHVRHEAIEDGQPLWPGRYSLADLSRIRADVGPSAWAREYRNAPHEEGSAAFQEQWLRYEEPPHSVQVERAVFMDPAAGTESGDYTAVVEVVRVSDRVGKDGKPNPLYGVTWVTRSWVMRETPRVGADRMARAAVESNGFPVARAVGVEEDTYKEMSALVRDSIARLCNGGPRPPVRPVKHLKNKIERIMRLQAPAESGALRFSPSLRGSILVEQLLDVPSGEHDDGPDALEGAWSLLNTAGPGIYV